MKKVIDIKTKKPRIIVGEKEKSFFNYDDEFEDGFGLWDSEYTAAMDMVALKGLFFNEPWPFIALDLVGDSLSQVPMCVKKKTVESDGSFSTEKIYDHPALMILSNPNPFQTYKDFIYNLEIEIDLMGNGILYFAKKSKQLFIIPAESVTLDVENNEVVGYRVHENIGSGIMNPDQAQVFPKKDIWHYRRPNPKSMLWGLSPFVPNRRVCLLNKYSSDWLLSFYLKGATPNVIIQAEKSNVDAERALRLLKTLETSHTGRANLRRPLIVPAGYKAEMMNQSIADQNFVELVRLNREDILQILRIPKHAVGLAESGSLGSEEHKQALKFFYTDSIMPRQIKISEFLTRHFQQNRILAEDEFLEFDNSEVGVLKEDRQAQAELAQSLMSIMSLDEIRSEVFDLEPLKVGELTASAYENSQAFSANLSASIDNEEEIEVEEEDQEEEEEEEVSLDTLQDYEAEEDDDDDKNNEQKRNAVKKYLIEHHGDGIVKNLQTQVDVLENESDSIKSYINKLLDNWIKESVDICLKELRKAKPKTKDVDDDETPEKIPSKKRLARLLQQSFDKDEEDYKTTIAAEFKGIPEKAFDITMVTIVNEENAGALEALRAKTESRSSKLLEKLSNRTFSSITETTSNQVIRTIEAGISSGKGLREIGEEISKMTGLNESRATTISRTEALTAVSLSQKSAMDSASEVIDDLVKVWVNANDNRVRGNPAGLYPDAQDNHWKLGGEFVDVDGTFSNGLDYPRDPKGKAFEVINCRCSFVTISKKDLDAQDFEEINQPLKPK